MDASPYILLPYGLSSEYQESLADYKDTSICRGPPRFRTASLLELSKLTPLDTHQPARALSFVIRPHPITRKRGPDPAHRKRDIMGFQRNIKRINMGPATGKEKRGRAKQKPQISVHKISKAGSKVKPKSRVGASQELPITLDSDDDAPAGTSQWYVMRGSSHNAPLINAVQRRHQRHPNLPVTDDESLAEQNTDILTGSPIAIPQGRPTKMQAGMRSQLSTRIKPEPPRLQKLKPDSLKHRSEHKPGNINMSLLDIDDFTLRSKVAQLMAVAPALPIVDLYHLIIDSQGDLPLARKHAIRMSEAPPAQYRPGLDADGDEVMVKIDPSDPAFEWDDDEPQAEPVAVSLSRPPRPKHKLQNNATKSKGPHISTKATSSARSSTKHCSNIGAKRTTSSSMNPTHARETSSDREFVIPDNTVHYDLDSDVSDEYNQVTGIDVRMRRVESDVDMVEGDDLLDLDIDMQPRFAHNARLLRHRSRSGKI